MTSSKTDTGGHIESQSNRMYANKPGPHNLIASPDLKGKEVVILSKKSVVASSQDIATQQKKIIVKDLLSVMRNDSRLAHRALVYQLQNKVL